MLKRNIARRIWFRNGVGTLIAESHCPLFSGKRYPTIFGKLGGWRGVL